MMFLIFLPIVFYLQILFGFFQQDEWLGFSQYVLHQGLSFKDMLAYFFQPSIGHFTPFSIIVGHSLYSIFGLNYPAFALVSLGLHAITSLLVFILFRQILKNNLKAVVGAILFGIFASSFQGTAWVVADLAGHLSGIFGLLAAISLFRSQTGKSLLFLTISLLFKEITLGLFVLFPIAIYIFNLKSSKKWFVLALVVYMGLRLSLVFAPNQIKDTTVLATQTKARLVYNFLTVPIKAISQSIVPQGQIRVLSEIFTKPLGEKIAGEEGSPKREVFVVKRTMEVVSLGLALIIIIICLSSRNRITFFALLWIAANSAIFSLAPERPGLISTIDSRYLYFVSIGSALVLVSLFWEKFKYILIFLAIINGFWLNKELSTYTQRGHLRSEMLNQIKTQHPNLTAKTIFYTESNSSFYGLPVEERILPFQSGLGQTMLSWYYESEKLPKEFYRDRFLWDILEEGYKEFDNRGFGYFRDFDKLAKTISDNKLPLDSVIGYRYDAKQSKLIDMTDEIRGRLKGFLSAKRKLTPNQIITISSEVIDGNRVTKWDSKIPYIIPQSFEFDLRDKTMVSQIDIDSYDNKDQDRVGYSILLSEDGKNWKQVFYSQKNPPKEDGVVRMPFEPTMTKHIKINQLGDHQFASWVIHELSVYESLN